MGFISFVLFSQKRVCWWSMNYLLQALREMIMGKLVRPDFVLSYFLTLFFTAYRVIVVCTSFQMGTSIKGAYIWSLNIWITTWQDCLTGQEWDLQYHKWRYFSLFVSAALLVILLGPVCWITCKTSEVRHCLLFTVLYEAIANWSSLLSC
jgi:ABC-type maltose transport system permease subunit